MRAHGGCAANCRRHRRATPPEELISRDNTEKTLHLYNHHNARLACWTGRLCDDAMLLVDASALHHSTASALFTVAEQCFKHNFVSIYMIITGIYSRMHSVTYNIIVAILWYVSYPSIFFYIVVIHLSFFFNNNIQF